MPAYVTATASEEYWVTVPGVTLWNLKNYQMPVIGEKAPEFDALTTTD